MHRLLPKVALKDVDGNAWPAERLAKTTVAVVWATWCTPCRADLPYFAKLPERFKARAGVQAVSFDPDENRETAKQFLDKNGDQFFAAEGFGGDGDAWVERVLARLKE